MAKFSDAMDEIGIPRGLGKYVLLRRGWVTCHGLQGLEDHKVRTPVEVVFSTGRTNDLRSHPALRSARVKGPFVRTG